MTPHHNFPKHQPQALPKKSGPNEMVQDSEESTESGGWLEEDTQSSALVLIKEPWTLAKTMLITDAKEYYGQHYNSPEVEKDSGLSSRINLVASLYNAAPSGLLFFFGYQSQGFIPALSLAIFLTGLAVKVNNDASTVLARRRRGTSTWSAGFLAVVTLGVVQSSISAISVEAFNNGEALASRYATQLVEKKQAAINDILANTQKPQKLEEGEQELADKEELFFSMDHDNPNRDRLHLEIWGPYAELNSSRSNVPFENKPLAFQVEQLQAEASAFKKKTEEKWQKKIERRHDLGDDLLFLRESFPEQYERHFNEAGQLTSGMRLIEQAGQSLAAKLTQKDVSGLTFPLFFGSLSCITSALALLMSLLHASSEGVKMSWDAQIASAVNDEFSAK